MVGNELGRWRQENDKDSELHSKALSQEEGREEIPLLWIPPLEPW